MLFGGNYRNMLEDHNESSPKGHGMPESSCRPQAEVAAYVRDIAHELAAMARSAGHGRLSFLLEMAVLEAAGLQDRDGREGAPSPCSGKKNPPADV